MNPAILPPAIYIYIYNIYIYKGFMVFSRSLGELIEDQMSQYE